MLKPKEESIEQLFELFLLEKRGNGCSENTIKTYQAHFKAIGKYLEPRGQISQLTKRAINNMFAQIVEEKKRSTARSYSITFVAFCNWLREEGYIDFQIKQIRCQEMSKQLFTDSELADILTKPDLKKCSFSEYRNWVVCNFLLDTGCRCSTVRNILIGDLDFVNQSCLFRINKNQKEQSNPLSATMCKILKEYLRYRQGESNDYLFSNTKGDQQTESSFRSTMVRYLKQRGSSITNIHTFRHLFARKYLLELNGNPFRLQKLLGHSTLDMTKHYCQIYDKDLLGMKTPLDTIQKKERIKMR